MRRNPWFLRLLGWVYLRLIGKKRWHPMDRGVPVNEWNSNPKNPYIGEPPFGSRIHD
jgi:hypothetical protein